MLQTHKGAEITKLPRGVKKNPEKKFPGVQWFSEVEIRDANP
jgi:hypothetical protein